jgi:tetratricopeptide (TPR) repeat protein
LLFANSQPNSRNVPITWCITENEGIGNTELRQSENKACDILEEIEKLVKRAEQLRENERIVDAEEIVREALDEYEDSWQLWAELGHILSRKQDFEGAAEAFLTATNLEPDEFWTWLYLGHAKRDLGDYEAAIDAIENALRVEIGYTEFYLAYYNLACYSALLGRKEEAMDYLKTALENDESLREWAREDSDLDSLRDDPGFEFLVEA